MIRSDSIEEQERSTGTVAHDPRTGVAARLAVVAIRSEISVSRVLVAAASKAFVAAARGRFAALALAAVLAAGGVPGLASVASAAEDGPTFDVFYEARLVPSERAMHVEIQLDRNAHHLHELRFTIDPTRHLSFEGDGEIESDGAHVTWRPPAAGGRLAYTFRIDHLRNERAYDSRCAKTWTVFRGGDMVPKARVRYRGGSRSRSRLRFVLPEGWSVAAPYTRLTGGIYRVEHDHRVFDRPTGWFVLGDLTVTREEIAGTKVAVAGPIRHDVHALDIIALLNWTLPELNRISASPLERLLIASAADPMWRGGLSGPGSLYVHADRPLISNDATSPLLHELVHTSMSARADDASDWIVEGLAEFYSMQLLARSGTVQPERVEDRISKWADEGVPSGRTHGGSNTVRGTVFMARLDAAIRDATEDAKSLDDVLRDLTRRREALDVGRLEAAILAGTGLDPQSVMPSIPGGTKRESARKAAAEE